MIRTGMKPNSQYKWEGVNYTPGLPTKEIAKIVREQLKRDFPTAKWSITTNYNEIRVHLMEYDKKVSHEDYLTIGTGSWIADKPISDEGKVIFIRVKDLFDSFAIDDSDIMSDYFHSNFTLLMYIGKPEKPFKVTRNKGKK